MCYNKNKNLAIAPILTANDDFDASMDELVALFGNLSISESQKSVPSQGVSLYGKPRKVQIIPSVLPADFGKLGADCKKLEDAGCDCIQFDVMDGNFVPNLT